MSQRSFWMAIFLWEPPNIFSDMSSVSKWSIYLCK
jgi:hypothetical protein